MLPAEHELERGVTPSCWFIHHTAANDSEATILNTVIQLETGLELNEISRQLPFHGLSLSAASVLACDVTHDRRRFKY
jgi:hypothetical protein